MKVAIAQVNTTIGDFEGNESKIVDRIRWAESQGADLLVFPELTVCGYFPRDLLEKRSFIDANLKTVERIAKKTKRMAVSLGFVMPNEGKVGRPLFNTMGVLQNGKVRFIQNKTLLPEYDVFDEGRYFEPTTKHRVVKIGKVKVGLVACEDMWSEYKFFGRHLYKVDPIEMAVKEGAELIIGMSASPFTIVKQDIRRSLVCGAAKKFKVPIVYCNLVGGNDELVFDGRSFVVDARGRITHEAKAFEEDSFVVDIDKMKPLHKNVDYPVEEEIRGALVLGLRDYMAKCGFKKVVIGISGGIDSAVVAAIACEAIGAKNVMGVLMPSPFTSRASVDDAQKLISNLGMLACMFPIGDIYESYRRALGYSDDKKVTLVEENIQARIRGNILMAVSNREGALVLSTGNKSELSTGYCTLYGDMAGGFALISDVPKTMVFALAKHLNRDAELIPNEIIVKPPSAELKPNQKDTDSLPDYYELDPIISAYVEDRLGIEKIVAKGFSRGLVEKVIRMIDRNEYKRRQAAPGVKITSKAFGTGRRLPIARKYF